jgi:hypothetical protein
MFPHVTPLSDHFLIELNILPINDQTGPFGGCRPAFGNPRLTCAWWREGTQAGPCPPVGTYTLAGCGESPLPGSPNHGWLHPCQWPQDQCSPENCPIQFPPTSSYQGIGGYIWQINTIDASIEVG